MDNPALILRLDLTDTAPDGPGWYLYATAQDDEGKGQILIHPVRVSGKAAVDLALRLQHVIGTASGNDSMTPTQIIGTGNQKVIQRIKDQIAYAEKQAQRIGNLRRILQTESEPES